MTSTPEPAASTTGSRIRSRPLRRALAVIFAASSVAVAIAGFLDVPIGTPRGIVAITAMLQALAAIVLLLTVRLAPSSPGTNLKQDQRLVRDRAHRTAYVLFGAAVVTLLLAVQIYATWSDWLPDPEALRRWFTSVAILYIATPSAIVSWATPNPDTW